MNLYAQRRGRWLRLLVVAMLLVHAVAVVQISAARSESDSSGESDGSSASESASSSDSSSDSGSDSATRTPTPTTRTPTPTTRTPTPTTRTPTPTTDTPTTTTKTPTATTKTPTTTTKTPTVTTRTPTTTSSGSASTAVGSADAASDTNSGADSGADSESESGSTTKTTIFTKSPYLETATPVPNAIPTADTKSSKSDTSDSSSNASDAQSNSKSTSESASSTTTGSTLNGGGSTAAETETSSDSLTPSPASSSGSDGTVATDTASASSTGLSSTLTLVLIMAGAVALVLVGAVLIYVRTARKSDEEEEDEIDAAIRGGRRPGDGGAKRIPAQSSTLAANYRQNDALSPLGRSNNANHYENGYGNGYGNDYGHGNAVEARALAQANAYNDMNANNPQYYAGYQQQQQPTYDQEPYPYQQPEARAERNTNASSIDYNDPNFDVLTPESQIALAHSQLSSVPSYRATGDTFENPRSYADSVGYSANASQIMAKYPALRKGAVENDVFGSDDESELNDDGDSVCDLSATSHDWNAAAAGRNTRATELRESSEDSPFAPGDSSSTAASGRSTQFQGASEFHASEYRPSSAYDKQSFQSHLFSEDGDVDIDRESSLYRDTNSSDASYR